MNIYDSTGVLIKEVIPTDESYRYRELQGDNKISLIFSLPEFINFPILSYVEFEGETYTLEKPAEFKKKGTRDFEYTLTLESPQAKLKRYKVRNTSDNKLKFDLTVSAADHLSLIVANLNLRDTGWSVGNCIDSTDKTISYNHTYCNDALQSIADEFETEWEIVGKVINLKKVEYNKDNPLALSYGQGNGFKPGVGRANYNDTNPVEILYVQGGEKNIDYSVYGSTTLLLPKSQQLTYEGKTYESDANGLYIKRANKDIVYHNEDSLDCSDIYPKRVGTVTAVEVQSADDNFYNIIDSSIPDSLNFNEYQIDGETKSLIFQSGMLAGREFDFNYSHSTKKIEIVPQKIDGVTMPNATWIPAVGDTYAVFNVTLPDAYVCDNSSKSGASWDMFLEAARYLYENEDQKFSFTGELNEIWAKSDWLNIGGKIKPGGYVQFTDTQFQTEGILIRIVNVKDYLNNPHAPKIELSNAPVSGSISGELQKISANEVVTESLHKQSISYTKRRFRDAKETISALNEALLSNFTNAISPITVQTMAMLVGDESLQFRFVDDMTSPAKVSHIVSFNSDTKVLTSPAGIIQHMTLGISTLSSAHAISEYKFWSIPEYISPALTATDQSYYLYAKVSKTDQTGTFILSSSAIAIEGVSGYYHLLIGLLNSEYDGERSYVDLYGYTEILPGRITTDKVVSADGDAYFDMANSAMKLGTALDFNSQGDGKLKLKGTIVQSQSGDEFVLGAYRGAYNSTYTYYQGDTVIYNGSTWLYKNTVPSVGNTPADGSSYWTLQAAAGTSALSAMLTNDAVTVPASADGTVTSFATATGTFKVYYGSTDVTSSATFAVAGQANVTGSITSAGIYSITAMSAATGYLTLTATYNGLTITCVFSISKAIAGTGADAVVYNISPSANALVKSVSNAFTPATVTFSFFKTTGSTLAAFTGYYNLYYSTDGSNFTQISSGAASNITVTPSSTYKAIKCELYADISRAYKVDSQTILVVSDGATGATGATGTTGATGAAGNYIEYQYAANGSTSTAPTFTATDLNPSGYSTTPPTLSSLQYCWLIKCKKNAAGTALVENWALVGRITPYDGTNGSRGPALAYRGIYSASSTYFGNSNRVDAVKYNDTYYVARTDAGTFTGQLPTNTSYWNTFGATFESVATGLLLAQSAYIENLIVQRLATTADKYEPRLSYIDTGLGIFAKKDDESGLSNALVAIGKDVGSMQTTGEKKPGLTTRDLQWKGNYSSSTIYYCDDRVYYSTTGYTYIFSHQWTESETPAAGIVPTNTSYWTVLGSGNMGGGKYSEITTEGVFANGSNINGLSSTAGVTTNFSAAFLLQKRNASADGISAAIYCSDQTTSGSSKAFSGYFNGDLHVNGLCLNTKYLSGSSNATTYLTKNYSFVLSIATANTQTVYLPTDCNDGEIIIFKQLNGAIMTLYPQSGNLMYDDSSVNSNYSLGEGEMVIAIFAKSLTTPSWIVHRV